jgi:hypothetical protein
MQTPQEIEDFLKESEEYMILQTAIDEIVKTLIIIEDGMADEFSQVRTLKKILESQTKMLTLFSEEKVISMENIKNLSLEFDICSRALQAKSNVIKTLNGYMNERMKQVKTLQLKKDALINSLKPATVLDFKDRNEKN